MTIVGERCGPWEAGVSPTGIQWRIVLIPKEMGMKNHAMFHNKYFNFETFLKKIISTYNSS